ncbi:Fe-S cluster assembly ATPase SufC [Ferrimicrobium acidiphilum]|uniref:Vegetative protein 296 n=1 Tax=Ferrimicrobium acidiphilum DSM 19497 TaxID=1121877 RepID=A0A0D8FYZ6_9ACTN|nr:Fe-S cluster assembly ATPase SufC [Ferrimicrobium acidiphilum]KJE78137.1 vegetative protein 296 [Ferrimicrobium acidiphilum DSM 19497]MCL5053576.1 Fe-S cluster assembly ATPase SufC [Gammaproteobacteria bacterium]
MTVQSLFEARDLWVSAAGTTILKGFSLTVAPGELHVIMGPNGSGKSSFANAIMGSSDYQIDKGQVIFKGIDISALPVDERAKEGIFLAFQYPEEIPGVSVIQFLRQALQARRGSDVSAIEVRFDLLEWLERLGLDPSFASRYLNEGFSGGEKKRNEIIQMAMMQPELAILDETDSGLDIDALRTVARGIETVREANPDMGVVLITHYQRILAWLAPTAVHVAVDGHIVGSGGMELVEDLEREGYQKWRVLK